MRRTRSLFATSIRPRGLFALINVSAKGKAVAKHLAHGDGLPGDEVPGMAGFVFTGECGLDAPPQVDDQTFSVDENSANGTAVGFVVFSDPDIGDAVTLTVTGGSGATAFSADGATGAITVADGSQLDFETTTSFTLEVLATDQDGASDTAVVTINVNDVVECIATESDLRAAAALGGDHTVCASPIVRFGWKFRRRPQRNHVDQRKLVGLDRGRREHPPGFVDDERLIFGEWKHIRWRRRGLRRELHLADDERFVDDRRQHCRRERSSGRRGVEQRRKRCHERQQRHHPEHLGTRHVNLPDRVGHLLLWWRLLPRQPRFADHERISIDHTELGGRARRRHLSNR